MARFPRTLADALAAQAEAGRSTRTEALSVDALAPIGVEQLNPELATNIETLNTDLALLSEDVALVDSKIIEAINDANALPITNDRFTEDSLSIWPFIEGAIPQGAIAPGAIGESDIADFAIAVKKIKSDRHHLY